MGEAIAPNQFVCPFYFFLSYVSGISIICQTAHAGKFNFPAFLGIYDRPTDQSSIQLADHPSNQQTDIHESS